MAMSHKDNSRRAWQTTDENAASNDQLKVGCLQRIADAAELMAKNYRELIDERDRYKRWYEDQRDTRRRLDRSISSLKGVITKIRNANQ